MLARLQMESSLLLAPPPPRSFSTGWRGKSPEPGGLDLLQGDMASLVGAAGFLQFRQHIVVREAASARDAGVDFLARSFGERATDRRREQSKLSSGDRWPDCSRPGEHSPLRSLSRHPRQASAFPGEPWRGREPFVRSRL